MKNQTLSNGVVIPAEALATIPGHALVIVDQRGGGAKHLQTALPGEKLNLPLIGRKHLLGHHVRLDDRLRHSFVIRQVHEDGLHGFSLEVTLYFRVLKDDKQLIALRIDDDPLRRIEEEGKLILPAPVRAMSWEALRDTPN